MQTTARRQGGLAVLHGVVRVLGHFLNNPFSSLSPAAPVPVIYSPLVKTNLVCRNPTLFARVAAFDHLNKFALSFPDYQPRFE